MDASTVTESVNTLSNISLVQVLSSGVSLLAIGYLLKELIKCLKNGRKES